MGSCGPKSVTTDPVLLRSSSKAWIPFGGYEEITFYHDTTQITFYGQGKETYFEEVRYMSDQGEFFTYQKDYFAGMEREKLMFTSPSSDYYLKYFLEKGKGETGEWDILYLQFSDGLYYSNDMKIVIYQSDDYNKGEVFSFKKKVTLNGNSYTDVYYHTQEQRPFELYYTEAKGIIAFKLRSNEIWTIDPDNLN
jgi:hypothetical protein